MKRIKPFYNCSACGMVIPKSEIGKSATIQYTTGLPIHNKCNTITNALKTRRPHLKIQPNIGIVNRINIQSSNDKVFKDLIYKKK